MHGDTAWPLIADLDREDATLYFQDRRRRGFNTILVNLIEHRFLKYAPRNAYGAEPFSFPGDFTSPNEAYFAHVDWFLERAADLGLLVLLAPAHLGFDGAVEGWYQAMCASGPKNLRHYGRFLANRYARFRNIVWIHGGDFNPPDRAVVRAVAEGIREVDVRVLHSAHCARETMASDYWGGESWLDFNTLYTHDPVHQAPEAMRDRGGRPFILLEGTYEGEHGAGAHRIIMQAYQALLSGACGHLYGNKSVWHFDGPGTYSAPLNWRYALGGPGAESMTHLSNVFSGIHWWTLEPDFNNRLLVGRRGGDHGRAASACSKDSSLALVCTPDSRTLQIDTTLFNRFPLEAKWYDPTNGWSHLNRFPSLANSRIETLEPPGRNSASNYDWLLVLRSVS